MQPPPPPPPWAIAVAAAFVGMVEQVLLNPASIWRSRAIAGRLRVSRFRTVISSWSQWSRGLWTLVVTQCLRNAWGYGGQAWLSALGMAGGLAGGLVGAVDGAAFTPSRRLVLLQHLGSRHHAVHLARVIVATEGWAGLWRGWPLNLLRTAWGGLLFFGTVQACRGSAIGAYPALTAAVATTAVTVGVNPLEVALARLYLGKQRRPHRWRVWLRGLCPALMRSVPPKALGFWAIQSLARAIS